MHMEEVHSLHVTEKVPSERNSLIQEEDHSSSYNIREIYGAFTLNLHMNEVIRKRVQKVKKSDGNLEEMKEDEVLFEKIDEDPMILATSLVALNQATGHNIIVLNKNILEAELEDIKLKYELISLWEEMKQRRNVDDNLVPLKENILEQQEKLHDFKVECFT